MLVNQFERLYKNKQYFFSFTPLYNCTVLYKHNSHEFKGQFAFAPLISKSGLKCLDKVRDQLRTEKDRTKIGWENLNVPSSPCSGRFYIKKKCMDM